MNCEAFFLSRVGGFAASKKNRLNNKTVSVYIRINIFLDLVDVQS